MSTEQANNKSEIMNELDQPEVKESLLYLIQKLPEIQEAVQSVDSIVKFGQAVMEDSETAKMYEERFSTYPIGYETIEAGIALLGKLPLLLQHVGMIEQITVFVQDVLGDEQSIEQITQSINELPGVEEGKGALQLVNEIKERAEVERQEQVSLFTLMKWLKDPTVQKGLHYAKTALTVIGEKSR